MAEDRWAAARAAKERKRLASLDINISKRQQKKALNTVKKSPALIIVVFSLILGLIVGFFAFTYLSTFDMNNYLVNGVICSEKDYVVVDMQDLKEDYMKENSTATMEDIYNSITLKDEGVICKFFGMDISNTVSIKKYYREDISYDYAEVENIDLTIPGVYYIEYKSSHFAFKNKTLIRTIIITEVENDG